MKILRYSLITLILFLLLIQPVTAGGSSDCWQETANYPKSGRVVELKTTFPEKQWWMEFNDPILNNYIKEAVSANQDIKIALARIEQANAQTGVVFGKEFPQITLRDYFLRTKGSNNFLVPNAGESQVKSSSFLAGGTQNLYILPLVAQYELDLFRTNHLNTKAARKAAEASCYNLSSVLIVIASDVATAYFNLLQADKLLKLQQCLLQNQLISLELRQSQFREGQISYDDILYNQESVSQIRANISDIQRLQGMLVHQLYILMGKPPAVEACFKRTDIDNISVNKEIKIGNPSQLIVRRPDILSAEKQLEKAGINISIARRQFLPTIPVIGTFGYASSNIRNYFDWNSSIAAIVAGFTQSLFTGGSKISTLRLNKALYKEAIESYQKTILNSFKDVEDSLRTLNTNITQYIQAEEDTNSSKQQLTLTTDRYNQGINSKLDVLSSEQQLINFQQNLVQSKIRLLITNISLYKALGGGY